MSYDLELEYEAALDRLLDRLAAGEDIDFVYEEWDDEQEKE